MISISPILLMGLYVSIFVVGIVLGGAVVFFFRRMAVNRLLRVTQRKTNRTVIEARDEAKKIIEQSRVEADKVRATADAEYRERRLELQRQENRMLSKTENLERKLEGRETRRRS